MIGLELVAGYLIAWAVRKARRVGTGLDAEVDVALDAGLERLHDVVVARLGSDPAVSKIEAEAVQDEGASERTQRRVQDAIEDAAEQDQDFAVALQQVLDELKQLRDESPSRLADFDLRGAQGVQIGDHNTQTNTFG